MLVGSVDITKPSINGLWAAYLKVADQSNFVGKLIQKLKITFFSQNVALVG